MMGGAVLMERGVAGPLPSWLFLAVVLAPLVVAAGVAIWALLAGLGDVRRHKRGGR